MIVVVVPGLLAAAATSPGGTRVPATFALHYPLLVAPRDVRERGDGDARWRRSGRDCAPSSPALHRRVGRVYVFTAIPAAVCAMVIGAATPFGPFLAVSNVLPGVAVAVVHDQRLPRRAATTVRRSTGATWSAARRWRCPSSPTASGPRCCSSRCSRCRTASLAGNEEHFLWVRGRRRRMAGLDDPVACTVQWWLTPRTGNSRRRQFLSSPTCTAGVVSGSITATRTPIRTRLAMATEFNGKIELDIRDSGAGLGSVRRADRARGRAQRPLSRVG